MYMYILVKYFRREDAISRASAASPSMGSASGSGSGGSQKAAVPEPSVDFEMDIKVAIDSGHCQLHPKEVKDADVDKRYSRACWKDSFLIITLFKAFFFNMTFLY